MARPQRCLGCRMCLVACPNDAVFFDGAGKSDKCDLCFGSLRGTDRQPACVAACTRGALRLVGLRHESAIRRGAAAAARQVAFRR